MAAPHRRRDAGVVHQRAVVLHGHVEHGVLYVGTDGDRHPLRRVFASRWQCHYSCGIGIGGTTRMGGIGESPWLHRQGLFEAVLLFPGISGEFEGEVKGAWDGERVEGHLGSAFGFHIGFHFTGGQHLGVILGIKDAQGERNVARKVG